MNPAVQRFLPPAIVLSVALYFGWPPAAPLDLGDDVVRATSVRWRPGDLEDPDAIEIQVDPFVEVLVADEPEQTILALPTKPAGPPEAELKAGIQLDGFAHTGGRVWAVMNGRPRLPGDSVRTADANRHLCEVVAIEGDHVVVRCEETTTKIHPRESGGKSRRPSRQAGEGPTSEPADKPTAPRGVAPPPA